MSSQRLWLAVGGVASAAALLYYLLRDDDGEETGQRRGGSSSGGDRPSTQRAERLDTDDLDEEERKALAEVSKKGYYHGRPKSKAGAGSEGPVSIGGGSTAEQPRRRADFDDFQKKWDRFDDDKFVRELEK